MNLSFMGRALQVVCGILVLLWLFHSLTSRMQPLVTLILYVALFFLGQVLVKRAPSTNKVVAPSVPSGFTATYFHENIAIDTNAGKIWLRDGARFRVFSKREILGWQVIYDNAQGMPTMVHGGVVTQGTKVKMNIRLGVQTTDLDHPEYFVRFKIKNIFQNTDRLYAEAVSWGNRLNAFLSS